MLRINMPVHVAVAVIENKEGKILVSRRHKNAHQGGLWEFPGGKLEDGETIGQALGREISEELGIKIENARPLISVKHTYIDREVILNVCRVIRYRGNPQGCEGQAIAWIEKEKLQELMMPAADLPVVHAIQLPEVYAITPASTALMSDFLLSVNNVIKKDVSMIQLRVKNLAVEKVALLAQQVNRLCKLYHAQLLVNADIEFAIKYGIGVHLSSSRLSDAFSAGYRHDPQEFVLGVSCHTIEELNRAQDIRANFAVLSPVMATSSHPQCNPLGWERFAQMVSEVQLPVYALGGLSTEDLDSAFIHGAQGVAGISAFWK